MHTREYINIYNSSFGSFLMVRITCVARFILYMYTIWYMGGPLIGWSPALTVLYHNVFVKLGRSSANMRSTTMASISAPKFSLVFPVTSIIFGSTAYT